MEGRTDKRPRAVSGDVPLVGRQAALRVAEEALGSAARGSFRFLALSGDPGAGKTRLLAEVAGLGSVGDLRVLAGRAAEFEQQIPFGALVDALDDHLEDHRPELDGATTVLLARVFPALMGSRLRRPVADPAAASGDASGEGRADFVGVARYQLHRAVRRLLEEVASPRAWCCSSTTCTGPTRRPSNCSTTSSGIRRAPGC